MTVEAAAAATSFRGVVALAMGLATVAAQAAPTPKDFAHGLLVTEAPGVPVQQFTVPEPVYQGAMRADLGDLRVFNAGAVVVPHALCTTPEPVPEILREQPLPVFPLRAMPARASGRTGVPHDDIIVRTPSGTSVQIGAAPNAAASTAITPGAPATDGPETFVVDASGASGALRALRLAWSTPDDASEARVSVESSEDLNDWRTVVPGTTLLHVAADGAALDRSHIDLPEARYRYLRLVRSEGTPVSIQRVVADVVHPGEAPAPLWFATQPAAATDGEGFLFDAGRLAPVQAARVGLASPNMALRVALESRPAAEAPWQARWSGEVSSVEPAPVPAEIAARWDLQPQAIRFAAVTDRFWRVRVLRGAETLGGGRPTLQLGYHPARLRFLAQGAGPYRVGYGSARVTPAESIGCDALLAGGSKDLLGAATVALAPAGAFGGADALTPPPKPAPVRQIVLWTVLVLGTAVLVLMALALLRRLRASGGNTG